MSNTERVREITDAFCENKDDKEVLEQHFAPNFEHWANGKRSGLGGYASRLARYGDVYESFTIPAWDETIAAGDRVVTSYVLEGKKKGGGGTDRFAVMSIWRLADGKVVSLREVDARL